MRERGDGSGTGDADGDGATSGEVDGNGATNGGIAATLTRRRVTIAGTVLVVLGLAVAVRELDVRAVTAEVATADPLVLVAAIAVYAVSWPVRGRRYGSILGSIGHPAGTTFLTLAVFVSQTANLAIPARAGDAVRASVVNTYRDVPYASGFASLTVERVFDLASIAVLAGVAMGWLAIGGDTGPLQIVAETGGARTAFVAAAIVSAATLGVGAVVVTSARSNYGYGGRLRARIRGEPRLEGALEAALQFVADVQIVARQPRALVAIGGASLAVWTLDVLTAVLVLAALDSGLPTGTLLAVGTLAVSVGNLAKVLPLSQGGIGLYEAAFTALVVGLTPVGASTALAAALVDHALKNAVTLVGGTGAVASLGVSLSSAAEESRSSRSAETGNFLGSPKK
ncbi:lysylphosphatidylglycerol synthase transmembrane domain-containing protein [Halosolutus halophilus]|uniref:lysylphosphatidylglycerol synthase transmembrane domain-containing protein n=1 Tax=Halosolutus halophilus TaxID=1552990 RepID=UPI002234EFE5|nr:lysylphosphatidylglycerol synthase transmembrane domain-containing protein [Halosolutus halophilus]